MRHTRKTGKNPFASFHDHEDKFYDYGTQMKFNKSIDDSRKHKSKNNHNHDAKVKHEDMSFMSHTNDVHKLLIYCEVSTEC